MDETKRNGRSGRISPLFTWRARVAKTDLSSTVKLVAFGLSLFMSEAGDSCFPTLDTLAAHTSLSRPAVTKAITALVTAGWLRRQPGGGRGRSTRYFALVPETVNDVTGNESEKPGTSSSETVNDVTPTKSRNTSKDHANPAPTPSPRPKNPIWDVLVELYGEPLSRGKAGRGRNVADLRELLLRDGVRDADSAVAEIRRRHSALAAEWGSRATLRALVEHWVVAGRIAEKPAKGLSPEEIALRARELDEEGR